MLSFFFFYKRFLNYAQSSFYIDYTIKYFTKVFVKSALIDTALFFCEKFIIEHLTKLFKASLLSAYNNLYLGGFRFFNSISCQVLFSLFYLLVALELWYIFY